MKMGCRLPELVSHPLILATCLVVFGLFFSGVAKAKTTVTLHYVERIIDRPPTLSNLSILPEDQGLQGARLGAADVNATGQFTDHEIRMVEHILAPEDSLAALFDQLSGEGVVIVANLPAADLLELSGLPWKSDILILNVVEKSDSLRSEECRINIVHTIPSRAMLGDALAQFLLLKRWKKWFLIEGGQTADSAFAAALRRSARKFGLEIVEEKKWLFDADMRRNAQAEVPPFTQGPDYDVVAVADEASDFGNYILYHTWYPRPVVGTQGLMPVAWHAVVEQYGAVQLQNRFRERAARPMNDVDYAAWLAVSSIGESMIRGNAVTAAEIRDYLLSDDFRLAAFKGRGLSFRSWSGQMRQPIPLVHNGALVSMSPQPGFLHQRTDLDTLGFDQAEVKPCGGS